MSALVIENVKISELPEAWRNRLAVPETSTDNLIRVLQNHSETIKAFVSDMNYADIGCLEIG